MDRIEILTGVERRRRWSATDKRRIVAEASMPGTTATAVARRYDLHPHQIYNWRRLLRQEGATVSGFMPVVVTAPAPVLPAPNVPSGSGTLEVALPNGRTLRVSEGIAPEALARLAAALDRR